MKLEEHKNNLDGRKLKGVIPFAGTDMVIDVLPYSKVMEAVLQYIEWCKQDEYYRCGSNLEKFKEIFGDFKENES